MKLKNGDYGGSLADNGLANTGAGRAATTVGVPVTVIFDQQVLIRDVAAKYTVSRSGRGTARSVKAE